MGAQVDQGEEYEASDFGRMAFGEPKRLCHLHCGCLYPLNAKPSPYAGLAEATRKPSAMQVSLSPIHNNDEDKKKFADRWQAV